ncbi:MAG: glycosyltransferase family 4 protein [Rhodothermia bacterium]|nr:glycosyltransferase family 4 protein [Rhodothermia bacterium]
MRIAYVCMDPGVPVFGSKGCSIHVQEILRFFASIGADVTAFTPRPGGPPPSDLQSISLERLKVKSDALADRETVAIAMNDVLRQALGRQEDFDVVYERHSLFSYAAMEYAHDNSIVGILEVNAPLVDEQQRHRHLARAELARRISRVAFRAATSVVAVSADARDYVLTMAPGIDTVHIVPNGVDTDRFRPPKRSRRSGRRDGFTAGFVGSLKPWHGVDDLVRAWHLVSDRIADSQLMIIGDGPERTNLEALAADLGVSDRTRFTGAVPHEDIPGLLSSMDVAVAPYPKGGESYFSPLKIFEYMAMEVPLVATRCGQIPELVSHGKMGLLVEPGDVAGMAEAIHSIYVDPMHASEMAAAARHYVIDNHTWRSVGVRALESAGIHMIHSVAA